MNCRRIIAARRRVRDLAAVLMAVSAVAGRAEQQAAPQSPAFEVATIKPNTTGEANTQAEFQPGGRFVAVGATVQALIRNAYRVGSTPLRASQVVGGPAWINTQRFDIVARGDTIRGPADMWPAIQDLLLNASGSRFTAKCGSNRFTCWW